MTKPDRAMGNPTFERRLADGFVVYDATGLLPEHHSRAYERRSAPSEIYVHHSGRLGRPGLRGALNSARYVVSHRDWPGLPYHYWIPRDTTGRIYRCQQDDVRTWHAGAGPNDRGLAICLQGNTSRKPPPSNQFAALAALIDDIDLPVAGHCEAPSDGHAKASCPGSHAMAFLEGFRA